ncbi:hypothetical protein GCM10007112_21220 [Vulcanisaeta souniana JCM 11219]|uniref:Uncharacterized protein n=1 Tax=Vulcanisaeta souniana JCM 11219 TaxID=1293586 RepID=A0A830E594_9CREN|nr:hypothetical protein GCM10007112_21220 [Vulcanisaeta souniana JCM 11219]
MEIRNINSAIYVVALRLDLKMLIMALRSSFKLLIRPLTMNIDVTMKTMVNEVIIKYVMEFMKLMALITMDLKYGVAVAINDPTYVLRIFISNSYVVNMAMGIAAFTINNLNELISLMKNLTDASIT